MTLPKITSAMLVLTHSCPLACRYCFVHQEATHMTYQTAKDAADFLITNGEEEGRKPTIVFFGGEPTVKWDEIIVPLTTYIRQEINKPCQISLTTNGILLNEERLNFIKDNQIDILFSIDGDKLTQDYNRPLHNGNSSFDILAPIIPQIAEMFPNTTFRMTNIPATCENTFQNIMFAKSMGFNQFFTVINVFEEWSQEKRKIMAQEMRKYSDYYINSYRHGVWPIGFSAIEDMFKQIKEINYAYKIDAHRTFNRCKACGKCGLGSNGYAAIHPNGNIYACQELTSNEGKSSPFYIGNIYTGVEENRRQRLISSFEDTESKSSNNKCSECKFNKICDGGCVANNYLITGDINIVPEVYCWWIQLLLDEAIYIMQTLGTEENEMFRKRWVNNGK